METIVLEWATFTVRWLHLIAGIAWIGSSFYFVHLDLSLRKDAVMPAGMGGEAWQVHGGGFYRMTKYMVAPPELPEQLTWFKWEAYTTWLSGMALLALIYYGSAGLYLVDPAVRDLPIWAAILASLSLLGAGWLIYDGLCRSALGRHDLALGSALFVLLTLLAWLAAQVFSGRGAFVQMGALVGTLMVANVFFVIIPNQKRTVAILLAGERPDPALGTAARQRSLHNNYLTLPVLFAMIVGHHPLAFAGRWNWAIFALLLPMGAAIRHFFNSRHAGRPASWWTWGVAAACALLALWLSSRQTEEVEAAVASAATFARVEEIVLSRCSMCHAREPVWEGVPVPPRGLVLETAREIRVAARAIEIWAVRTHAMPPGNVTDMQPVERAVLASWLTAGTPLRRGER